MLSRLHAFRIGCALTIIAGIGWLSATQHTPVAMPAKSAVQPAESTSALFATDTVEPEFKQIRKFLGRQRHLGPAEREREDESRQALQSLLTDGNAANIVQSLSADDLNSEFGLAALAHWASTDPLAAALWLAQQPAQSAEQTWAIAQAITKDPVVLEVLGERLPAGPWRETLLANASLASLPDSPVGALLIAQRLQFGAARTRALLTIADEWTLRDPAAAACWIASEPDLRLRDELLSAASAAHASTDPLGALTWTFGISSAGTFERSVGKISAMWADYEPERARRFTTLVEPHPISPAP